MNETTEQKDIRLEAMHTQRRDHLANEIAEHRESQETKRTTSAARETIIVPTVEPAINTNRAFLAFIHCT